MLKELINPQNLGNAQICFMIIAAHEKNTTIISQPLSWMFQTFNDIQLNTIFTVGEAVRSTCGNPHENEENEEEEERFHLSHLQTILCPYSKYDHKIPTGGT